MSVYDSRDHSYDIEGQTTRQNQTRGMSRRAKYCIGGTALCALAAAGGGAAYYFLGNQNSGTPDVGNPSPTPGPTLSPVNQLDFPGVISTASKAPGSLNLDWLPLQGDDPEFATARYEMQYSTKPHFAFDEAGVSSQELVENQEAIIEGLTPNSTVYFKMRAKLGNGTSLVPPQIYFNSSKTIAFEPVFQAGIVHKNLNELGYRNISVDQNLETITVEYRSDIEPLSPGQLLTGMSNDGTGILGFVSFVQRIENELSIVYIPASLEQVFEEYHETSNIAIVDPSNTLPENRRYLQEVPDHYRARLSGRPIYVPFKLESENEKASIDGVFRSHVSVQLEALMTGARLKSASFVINGDHRLDVKFGYKFAAIGGEISFEKEFEKKFKTINQILKALKVARTAGGPLGLLMPELEIEAEFLLHAEGEIGLEAKTGGSFHHKNKIFYTQNDGWNMDNSGSWKMDDPELPEFDIKATSTANLKLVPEVSISLAGKDIVEAEIGPFLKAEAEAGLADEDIAGKVGAIHLRKFDVTSGVNLNVETDLTSWFGFGEPTNILDKDFFVTEHVKLPEFAMGVTCKTSSEPNIVEAEVTSSLKEGKRLKMSTEATKWHSRFKNGVDGRANGKSYDLTIDSGKFVYPVDVYRYSQLERFPNVKLYNKETILAGTCEAVELDDDVVDDDVDTTGNGKCKPEITGFLENPDWPKPLEVDCCPDLEGAVYLATPMYELNQKIAQMAANFKERYDFIYESYPDAIMEQAKRAVRSIQGTWTTNDYTGLDSLMVQWNNGVLDVGNELINTYHISTGPGSKLTIEGIEYIGIPNMEGIISNSETLIGRLERNNGRFETALTEFANYKTVLESMKSIIQSSSYPEEFRDDDLVSIEGALDLWQIATDDVIDWQYKMFGMIGEFRNVISYAEEGIAWIRSEPCNTECACKSEEAYEAAGASSPQDCYYKFCEDCLPPYCN